MRVVVTDATGNVGTRLAAALADAVARAGVPSLVYASSVGAHRAGPEGEARVDESWPVDGIPTSSYSRHKAAVERRLDAFEKEAPEVRVVRLRPGLIFKRGAASEIRPVTGPFPSNVAVVPAIGCRRAEPG